MTIRPVRAELFHADGRTDSVPEHCGTVPLTTLVATEYRPAVKWKARQRTRS